MVLDKHGRYPYYLSNNRDVLDPKVSKFLIQNGLNIDFPEGKKFALALTHDIDKIHVGVLDVLTKSLKNLSKFQMKKAIKNIRTRVFKQYNPYHNFKEIIDIEEKYNSKSTFYFQTCGKKSMAYHPDYNIDELKQELKYIINKGWEVGLHGSYFSHNNIEKIKEEKKF